MTIDRDSNRQSLFTEHYDLLVIGGGATGAGIALDSALRGYKTALVEAGDFASGSSSRSTKLLHGGVRYLQKAFLDLDWRQLALVKESLRERSILMKIAPHLTTSIPIILPIYNKYKKLYFWAGLKLYEWLSGTNRLGSCQSMNADELRQKLPCLSEEGLHGGIQYVDGQFDDARLNIAIIQTAVERGACCLNYVRVDGLIKKEGKICGASVVDEAKALRGEIRAAVVVNAAGCFADEVRKMDQPSALSILAPSRGSHFVLKNERLQLNTGFLIPSTSDGRVIFALPWQGEVLVGTTDISTEPQQDPQPSEDEVNYLLEHLNKYLAFPVGREDITAAWAGIRPLYKGKQATSTSNLSRDCYIERSSSGLYTIVGGKWTTYRLMAKNLLDKIVHDTALPAGRPCSTETVFLAGGESYPPCFAAELAGQTELPSDVIKHLIRSYGTNAKKVVEYAKKGYSQRLLADYPYIEAEVVYVLHNEFAQNADDILFRRLRLGFMNQKKALEVRGRIDEIIALC